MSTPTSNTIAKSRTRDNGTKRQYALQAARMTLAAIANITDGLQIPFLKAAPQTLNQIITLADSVKTNKDACGQLAKQATDLIEAIAQASVGKTLDMDDNLRNDIEQLRKTLESIQDYMFKMTSRKMWKRVLASSDDGVAITEFQNKLSHAVLVFQVKDQISARISQHAVAQHILQKVTDIHDHLTTSAAGNPHQSEFLFASPTYPECFYGRDEFVATSVDLILTHSPAKLAVLGPGGIGKTTVAAAIFHNKQIVEKFGEHRAFVSCEPLISAQSLLETLCRTFELSVQNSTLLKALMFFLESSPCTLLVLDNLETLWDADDECDNVQTLLKNLSSLNGLTLIVTMRGTLPPDGVLWTEPALPALQVLSNDAAKMIYHTISPTNDDVTLELLLNEVDCLPLAVTLLAHLGKCGFSPEELHKRWMKERSKLISLGGKKKSKSLNTSIALSINSPLIRHEDALSLLRIIAYLPAGLPVVHLPKIASCIERMTEAQIVLFRTGLAYLTASKRLTVLSPIKFYVSDNYKIEANELSNIKSFYFELATEAGNFNFNNDVETKDLSYVLEEEKDNIIFLLHKEIHTSINDNAMLLKILNFSNYQYLTIPSTDLLENVKEHIADIIDDIFKAKVLRQLGRMYEATSNYTEAKDMLSNAMTQFQQIGERLEAAQCLQSLGDIAKMQSNCSEATEMLTNAMNEFQQVGGRMGAAQCLQSLGDIAHMQNNYSKASEMLNNALGQFQQIGGALGAAHCLRSLGNIARMHGNYSDATEMFTTAMTQFQQIGNKLGAAYCLQSLGIIAYTQGNYSEAKTMLNNAMIQFQQACDRLGAAHCLRNLGNIARMCNNFSDATEMLSNAIMQFQQTGDRLGPAQCLRSLGIIAYMKGNYSEAKELFNNAMSQFKEIGQRLGVAQCLDQLGNLALQQGIHVEAKKALTEAASLFEEIGFNSRKDGCLVKLQELECTIDNC
ncbi:hypothetical protein BD410DRAFT_772550 [Rickenella mellea]|uniref:Uncharacterized protein n=1 Tax=Rickenella mellea TaxID=50990 RepID=A0A4Y7Q021_9AGAM|nr:hypothetical protein BD410DRAFT_772550 [Rickenella mellea]